MSTKRPPPPRHINSIMLNPYRIENIDKRMLSILLDNLEVEEYIFIISNYDYRQFIKIDKQLEPENQYYFNTDFYNQWKLKIKIEDF